MVYEWKYGTRFSADITIIMNELKEIGEAITPDKIIRIARNKKTELHKCFTWDDSEAAHLYRKEQARNIIQSIVIIPDTDMDDSIKIIRAYESVTVGKGKAYVSIGTVLRNDDWKDELFSDIYSSIEQLIHKIENLEDICGDDHTMNNVKNRLVAVKELIKE